MQHSYLKALDAELMGLAAPDKELDGLLGNSRVVACLHDLLAQLPARLAVNLAALLVPL